MVKKRSHIVIIFLAIALGSCDPHRFSVETKHPVDCRIFSDHNSVDSHLYGFDMHPDAIMQVTSSAWTQYDLGVYVTLSGGEGFQLMLRPIVEENVIDSGLVLTFLSGGGYRLDSAGVMLDQNSSFRFPKNQQTYMTVYNEESYLQVTVGCDTVMKRYTKRKSSDDIVLRTLPGSELRVLDPEWKRIRFVKEHDSKPDELKEP
ncbi:MAG: hypothetical protein Q8916_11655 [Bacteroidota bacterium]|nr:hypothetical protein [Bacteroidota bacterium]MDP4231045.1 hypothetical protein [Bacteroidota bacterium]MDP4234991.1 hypothetical protein [Bacteroidota bacterium]